ncbi:hypothetical protein [Lebetimonas sp. JH292]|uniref:hypothetical protein n=1 Tax=Lebetimonas sp. JH292 TaxID=990068 RepID=UPI0004630E5A|nr:hypothetical protein [Lebetimonas sp. JH292]
MPTIAKEKLLDKLERPKTPKYSDDTEEFITRAMKLIPSDFSYPKRWEKEIIQKLPDSEKCMDLHNEFEAFFDKKKDLTVFSCGRNYRRGIEFSDFNYIFLWLFWKRADIWQERKLTALLVPFMSCGARLPIYALFTAVFFKAHQASVVQQLRLSLNLRDLTTGDLLLH